VFSPTSILQKTIIVSTALVGVFTNKHFAENNYCKHRPCWCYHQQESIQKQLSRAQPLLVFSPTSILQKTIIVSTALVGVFTNKHFA
jgi:hypothetical protein